MDLNRSICINLQGSDNLKRIFLLLIALIFVTGCTKQVRQLDATKGIEDGENNTLAQESKLEDFEVRLKEAEIQLTQLENLIEMKSDEINKLNIHLNQALHILNSIPALEVKLGYINNFDFNETLQVQLVNMLEEPDAPNGFKIEKTDNVMIKLNNKSLIYNELGTREVSIDEFRTLKEHHRLYNIYMINNEIIMLTEMYIP